MRLDKFLKVSRLIKRRPVAKEVADKGRIKINGKLAKSSSDVKFNDTIEIRFGNKIVEVRVTELKEFTRKEDADKMYELYPNDVNAIVDKVKALTHSGKMLEAEKLCLEGLQKNQNSASWNDHYQQ